MNLFMSFLGKKLKKLKQGVSLNTITTKLLMLFLFMTVIPLIVLAQFSTDLINSNMKMRAKSQLELNIRIVQKEYKEKIFSLKDLVLQGMKINLEKAYDSYKIDGNKNKLSATLRDLRTQSNLSFLLIVDKNKKVVASANNHKGINKIESFSDLINKVAVKRETLASSEVFKPSELEEDGKELAKESEIKNSETGKSVITGLSMVVAMPILNKDQDVVVTVIAGKLLAKDTQIADAIRGLTGATFMISEMMENGEALTIATSLTREKGERALGKLISSKTVKNVLAFRNLQEREWQIREYQLATYLPVLNAIGNIVGIIYIGVPEKQFTMLAEQNIWIVSMISVMGLFCAIILSSFFSRSITSPILRLAESAKLISSGDLSTRVNVKGSNEISLMGETFNDMAESLQKEERLRDDFVATLTHDLKVPLLAESQTIKYMLQEKYGQITGEQREILDVIKSTNHSTLDMVNTLLEVYRYDAGKNILFKTEADISTLVSSAIKELSPLAEEKKVDLKTELVSEGIIVDVDEREIKRVIHNLVANAISSTLQRGEITLKVLRSKEKKFYSPEDKEYELTTLRRSINIENQVFISVYDTGIGMEAEDMDNLFKRFSGNKGRKPSSTGLGLYYSQQVISAHNGHIWAESEEGRGSSFKFTLPIIKE